MTYSLVIMRLRSFAALLSDTLARISLSLRDLWAATNNTVGFNHMIASGPDAVAYASGARDQSVALALETMYQYTAYFADNDPREVYVSLVPGLFPGGRKRA